ncbi:T9SS type A sorting domain-containing protein [Tenacibaculum xiamenense]|uniref:T9SS type A sorting domain-containing protein n=1 Tax=Tenacibaculum xiamenense TaxID=1261553 RepID=UPI003893C2A1
MMKKLLYIFIALFSTQLFSQNISFSFVNARNTSDGTNDFYEADIYIASDSDVIIGSGQIYLNYNTEAFGENVHTSGNFEMLQPSGSILATNFFGGTVNAYNSFVVNDNSTSRVSTSFQQLASSGTIGMPVVNSTALHLFSIKIKYIDVNKEPNITFETGGVFLDQFYTACGPTTAVAFGTADCTNEPGTQITGDTYDSSGASLPTGVNWTGNSSAFWAVASNWGDSVVPDATKNVTIPNVANDPILNSGSYEVNDLTLNADANLTIDSNGNLKVKGNLTNNGLISLEADESNGGVFISEGVTSGQVTFQKDGLLANQWTIISVPVNGQSIKEFAENPANDIRVNTSVTPNRYAIACYDDSNASGAKWVYYTENDLSTNTLTFEPGKGYAISRATDGSVTFTGTIDNADVTQSVNESEWNAIGNPYTAYVPLNDISGENFIAKNSAKFDPSFVAAYTWDRTQNKYVANTLLDSEVKLVPGQGFFVRTTSGVTDVIFNENQRGEAVSGGASGRSRNSNNEVKIELNALANGTNVTTKILYNETATTGLDAGYDIGNFDGASFDIFSKLVEGESEHNFTIQSLPINNFEEIVVPIGLVVENGTEVVFSMNSTQVPSETAIYLEDKVKNTLTDLTNSTYTVTIEETGSEEGRFYLHTSSEVLSTDDAYLIDENISILNSGKKEITVKGNTSHAEIKIFSLIGKEVLSTEAEGNTTTNVQLNHLSTGVYIVNVTSDTFNISRKIILE